MDGMTTSKGKAMLSHRGFRYRRGAEMEGRVIWRCIKKNCSGRLHCHNYDGMLEVRTSHNHAGEYAEECETRSPGKNVEEVVVDTMMSMRHTIVESGQNPSQDAVIHSPNCNADGQDHETNETVSRNGIGTEMAWVRECKTESSINEQMPSSNNSDHKEHRVKIGQKRSHSNCQRDIRATKLPSTVQQSSARCGAESVGCTSKELLEEGWVKYESDESSPSDNPEMSEGGGALTEQTNDASSVDVDDDYKLMQNNTPMMAEDLMEDVGEPTEDCKYSEPSSSADDCIHNAIDWIASNGIWRLDTENASTSLQGEDGKESTGKVRVEVLSDPVELLKQGLSLRFLQCVTGTEAAALQFKLERGLARTTAPICVEDECYQQMRLHSSHKGQLRWRCSEHKERQVQLDAGSIFMNSPLSDVQHIQLLFLWAHNTPLQTVSQMAEVSRSVASEWFCKFRAVCSTYLRMHPCRLGGSNVVVQMDCKKYTTEQQELLLFVAYCPRSKRGVLELIADEQPDTLSDVIKRRIAQGSVLHSEPSPCFASIDEMHIAEPYKRCTINNNCNLTDPRTGVSLNHLECYWKNFKRRVDLSLAVNQSQRARLLDEYRWRELRGRTARVAFKNLIRDIRSQYPLP